jgi:hypothetical protein
MALELNVKMRLRGHFLLEAINADTGDVRRIADFDNLIVNQGLNFIATGGPASSPNNVVYYGCVVGTGTNPPSATDTSLQTFLAGTANVTTFSNSYSGASAWTVTSTTVYQFGVGAAAGNLTEIGMVAPAVGQTTSTTPTSSSPIFSRALIMVGGSPGTITILSNEILQVTYTITTFLIQTPLTGSFSLNTDGTITTVNYSLLSANATNPRWQSGSSYAKLNSAITSGVNDNIYPSGSALGLPSGTPTGTATGMTGSTTVSLATYTAGTFFQSFTYTLPIAIVTASNSVGAMTVLNTTSGGSFSSPLQISFSPAIGKTNAQTMQIVINVGWSN